MPNFTDDIPVGKKGALHRRGVLRLATIALILALIILSIIAISTDKYISSAERITEAVCSWLVIVPGAITLLRRKKPIPYARFLMFSLLMSVVMVLTLSETGFHPPLNLLITASLWALPLPLDMLYNGIGLYAVIILDLLLLGAFFPALPVFHYTAFLLLMCVPLAILTIERGWQGGLGGFIPLFWGLIDTKFTDYQDAGLFLLIWAPILGGISSALGLLVGDYRRLRKISDRLKIYQRMNREVLGKESFKEGIKTMLRYILESINCNRYLLKIEGEYIEPLSLSSIPPPSSSFGRSTAKTWRILERRFVLADTKGEVLLERDEEFGLEEEELLTDMLMEVTPAMEKLLYLEKAVEMAISDSLTSLANRTCFLYWLREDIHRSNRYKTPLSLLLLDIDGFKTYNDIYGHQAGDAVLKKIGERLKTLIRKSDIAARYGGDEFAILFPYANLAEAKKVSERIRENISNMRIKIRESEYLTISGGLTMFKEGEKPEELLRRADILLYQAKEKGGNRIEVG